MSRAHLIAALLVGAVLVGGGAAADSTATSDAQWKATRDDARPGDFATQIRVREEVVRFADGVYVNRARLTLVQARRWWSVRLDVPFVMTNRESLTSGARFVAGLGDLRLLLGAQPIDGMWFRLRLAVGAEFPTATEARLGNATWRLVSRLTLAAWPSRTLELASDWWLIDSVSGLGGGREVQGLILHSRARLLLPRRTYLELDPYAIIEMATPASHEPTLMAAAEIGGRLSAVSAGLRGAVHAAGPLREEWRVWLELRVLFERWLFAAPKP